MRAIGLGWNGVPEEAEGEIVEVFRRGQYSPGERVKRFEEEWAKAHEAKHSIFMNSGTDALRISLESLKERNGWRDGDKVAVPALTFSATVNVILQVKMTPVFVDVGSDYTMSPEKFMDVVFRGNIRAVMPVHLFGNPVDNNLFIDAKRNGIRVLEDSCETVLNRTQGEVSCHSTYMAHHVTTGVGGFASTNDGELRGLIWSFANHGRREPKRFDFDRVGYSARGTEFEAALGLSQMKTIHKQVERRGEVAKSLFKIFQRDRGITPPFAGPGHTFMMYPLLITDKTMDRDDLCRFLKENGIETRRSMPITDQPCYRNWVAEDDYPVAKNVNRNGFYIPCHPGMRGEDIDAIEEVFERYFKRGSKG